MGGARPERPRPDSMHAHQEGLIYIRVAMHKHPVTVDVSNGIDKCGGDQQSGRNTSGAFGGMSVVTRNSPRSIRRASGFLTHPQVFQSLPE